MEKRKILVAITGASGAIYAKLLLQALRGKGQRAQDAGRSAQSAVDRAQSEGRRAQSEGDRNQSGGLSAQSEGDRNQSGGLRPQSEGYRAQSGGLRTQDGDGSIVTIGVIFSDNATEIWEYELGEKFVPGKEITLYKNSDFYAPFASGSSDWDTMIICPASMGIVGRIAGGISNDLITRAADVMLKERRRLILVPRETPYSLIHLSNMKTVTEAGAIVCPATPSFYSRPETIDDLAMTVVERVLDLAGVAGERKRWGE